jgi:hypothetical protein
MDDDDIRSRRLFAGMTLPADGPELRRAIQFTARSKVDADGAHEHVFSDLKSPSPRESRLSAFGTARPMNDQSPSHRETDKSLP